MSNEEQKTIDYKELIRLANTARNNAYSPYSHFKVGAALLCGDEKIFLGCNIENAAFSPTVCAERVAFFKAVSEGNRSFKAIAVVGGKEGEEGSSCPPCGVCRQVMSEFCEGDFEIVTGKEDDFVVEKLKDLLPGSFSLK